MVAVREQMYIRFTCTECTSSTTPIFASPSTADSMDTQSELRVSSVIPNLTFDLGYSLHTSTDSEVLESVAVVFMDTQSTGDSSFTGSSCRGIADGIHREGNLYLFLRKVLSLPYLSHEHITSTFNTLASLAADVGGPVNRVMEYVGRTWVNGTVWTPEHLSVLRETVRINNDFEGWYRKMKSIVGRTWAVCSCALPAR
ncbi:hypothetical protein DPMN_148218 [Dreissena polymorpha]|uniref:Uncharacterized protein n=1 Tax=Dreissena polymorpha TaxID=45954 RepID=A0A9D4F9D1_DREPO|nr:hypothetical protein DPMN_148218 [Dreissena polymorpha]